MVEIDLRYLSPNGTSRDAAARFAGEILMALADKPPSSAVRLDLTAMLDPGRAWIDELLNRRVVPYCRERGIRLTVFVAYQFVHEQLARCLDPPAGTLVDIRLAQGHRAATRQRLVR